jgi:UDP-2-acetamido-3-amino-2,3-dideoxy-glucuronate N-acetyltransferase
VTDARATVDRTADIEEGATLGSGSAVQAGTRIRTGATVGAHCTIGRDVLIDEDVSVGDRVVIEDGALLYRGTTVEDGVFIGPGAIITNDRYPRAVVPDDVPPRDPGESRSIVLRHGSSIGAGAVIVPDCVVDRFATVGAGAIVARDVPAHALVVGSPARRIGWVCACGTRLLDSNGSPAPAEVERYATDPLLSCPRCDRRYTYIPEQDALGERSRTETRV